MLEKIGQNIGKIFLGIIAIALFIFGYQCGSGNIGPKTDSKTIIDTFTIHTTDTIKPDPRILWYPSKPKIRIDTVSIPVYLDSIECNRIYVYDDTIKTKDYDLYRKMSLQGKLRYDSIGVKLKVPLMVTNSTTVTITKDSLIIHPYKYEIHTGILATPKMLAPMLELSVDKWTYSAGYDPFNKQPVIQVKYRIAGWCPKNKKK